MASAQSLIGLFGIALLLARLAAAAARRDGERRRRVLAGITFVLAWVPLGALSLAGYVRGVTGDLSVTTIVLLVVSLVGRASTADRKAVSAVVAGALFLYPMALGVSGLDPYRLGYGPNVLLLVVLIGAAAAWLRERYLLLACLVLAVAAHALDLMESSNLWDYLLDPWVALVSIYDLRRVRRKA